MIRSLLMSCLLLICLLVLSSWAQEVQDGEEDELIRAKRQYGGYGGYGDYYGGDYWYAGRVVGVIVGALLLLLCCCAPCVCALGIWFLGWFGIRAARDRKNREQSTVYVGSRGDERRRERDVPVAAFTTSTSSNVPPAPAPRSTINPNYNQRSTSNLAGDSRVESRERRDDFDSQVIYQAEDHFYSSSRHSPPEQRGDEQFYRSSRF